MLDIRGRTPNGHLETVGTGTAVAFHDDTLQTEKTGTVVLRGVEFSTQPAQERQGRDTDDASPQRAPEQGFDTGNQHACHTLAGLEQDIAYEAIAHSDIGLAPIKTITLDEPLVVEISCLLQKESGLFDLLVPLDLFGPDIQQRHPGPHSPKRLGGHGAHHRKLKKLLGGAVDICAEIQQQARITLRRYRRDHGWPVNTRQSLEHLPCQRHERSGIAGAYTGLSRTITNLFEGDAHRGARLATQCLAGPLVHADHFGCINDFQTRTINP